MPLTSISLICPLHNVAGLTVIRYAPLRWINMIDSIILTGTDNIMGGTIIFNGGKNWLTMPAKLDSKSLSIDGAKSEQGGFYDFSLKSLFPTINNAVTAECSKMVHHEFLVHAVLPSGQQILMGNLERGCDFEFNLDTKDELGNTIGIGMSWMYTSGKPIVNANLPI